MSAALLPIDAVRPSTYNPREADEARLAIVELSLRKLGFVLPIFADASGEILSGHQRHHVAGRIGCRMVPVDRTKALPLAERKAINIAFNRGTNDMPVDTNTTRMSVELAGRGVWGLAEGLPDRAQDGPKFFRCLDAAPVRVPDLVKVNSGRWIPYARALSRTLAVRGISMPVIATRDLQVINGIGRLEMAAENRAASINVVFVEDHEAAFADAVLNFLSMDFNVHERYADLLRFNSFRRARQTRRCLGRGFIFAVAPRRAAKDFDVTNPGNSSRWKRVHGCAVLDFGAGHLTETEILRSIGVGVTPFEPYRLGADGYLDKEESLHLARAFLAEVRAGRRWSSLFCSSVLNSVPFAADRRHIACILAVLAPAPSRVYAVASATAHDNWRSVIGKAHLSERRLETRTFALDYEPGIVLGDIGTAPKVQKYHSPQEFHALFSEFFEVVQVTEWQNNVQAVCERPRPVDPVKLANALAFEFDLPYPDGSRFRLVDEAKAAFGARLGVTL